MCADQPPGQALARDIAAQSTRDGVRNDTQTVVNGDEDTKDTDGAWSTIGWNDWWGPDTAHWSESSASDGQKQPESSAEDEEVEPNSRTSYDEEESDIESETDDQRDDELDDEIPSDMRVPDSPEPVLSAEQRFYLKYSYMKNLEGASPDGWGLWCGVDGRVSVRSSIDPHTAPLHLDTRRRQPLSLTAHTADGARERRKRCAPPRSAESCVCVPSGGTGA